jgi:ribosome-associated protein
MTRKVMISREPVELYKILKFEGLAENGGAAKVMVSEGHVLVNGEVETRKRRKIVSGDLIECQGEVLQIVLAS